MPAPPPPAAPAPHAALRRAPGEVAGRRERGRGSAALPRGRRQRWPAAPGNGAEARSSAPAAGEQGRRETPSHSGDTAGFYPLLPTPSRSPQPRSTRPDSAPLAPTPSRVLRRQRDGAVGARGRSAPVPPPRPSPPRPPPRPAPAPPQPPPAAARLRRPGGLCPCAEPSTARPQPGAESPGKPLLRGSSLEMHRNSPRAEMEPRGVPKARINVKGVVLALRNPPPVIKWSNPTEGPY